MLQQYNLKGLNRGLQTHGAIKICWKNLTGLLYVSHQKVNIPEFLFYKDARVWKVMIPVLSQVEGEVSHKPFNMLLSFLTDSNRREARRGAWGERKLPNTYQQLEKCARSSSSIPSLTKLFIPLEQFHNFLICYNPKHKYFYWERCLVEKSITILKPHHRGSVGFKSSSHSNTWIFNDSANFMFRVVLLLENEPHHHSQVFGRL